MDLNKRSWNIEEAKTLLENFFGNILKRDQQYSILPAIRWLTKMFDQLTNVRFVTNVDDDKKDPDEEVKETLKEIERAIQNLQGRSLKETLEEYLRNYLEKAQEAFNKKDQDQKKAYDKALQSVDKDQSKELTEQQKLDYQNKNLPLVTKYFHCDEVKEQLGFIATLCKMQQIQIETSDLTLLQEIIVEQRGAGRAERVPGDMSSFFLWVGQTFQVRYKMRVEKTSDEKKREESRMKSKRISPYKKVETNLIEQETINKFFFDSIENDATPLEDLPIKGFQFLTEMFERKNAPKYWL